MTACMYCSMRWRMIRPWFEAAPGPKDIVVVPDAGHTDFYDFPEVPARVIDFVRQQAG